MRPIKIEKIYILLDVVIFVSAGICVKKPAKMYITGTNTNGIVPKAYALLPVRKKIMDIANKIARIAKL